MSCSSCAAPSGGSPGSYERSSFNGNDFPTTSWVADTPRVLAPGEWRLEVAGLVERPAELTLDDLDAGDELVATLDCTGGFYSRQRWRGIALERLLSQARPVGTATHLRVISHTGYRWGFGLGELDDLLLATHVGGEALSHGHGAPVRLVARDRRGFQWVKWVVRVELHDGPDGGAAASTVWSSLPTRVADTRELAWVSRVERRSIKAVPRVPAVVAFPRLRVSQCTDALGGRAWPQAARERPRWQSSTANGDFSTVGWRKRPRRMRGSGRHNSQTRPATH